MAQITINTPTATLQFPEGTPNEVIRAQIDEHASTPDARQSALDQWADQYVANERQGGGVMQSIGDTVSNVARGTPIGSWLDEGNAAIASATGMAPYDEALAYQRARDRATDKSSGHLGTVEKILGGVASIPFSPIARVMQGTAMLPQAVNGLMTGLGYGALYGAGEGESGSERLVNAGQGAAIGGVLGGAAAPVAKGAANAAGYVADKLKGMPADLQSFTRGAVDRVSRGIGDDVTNAADIPRLAARHGQEGMLADIGPNVQGQIGAISRTPGEGRTIALRALNDRAEGAGQRITDELNASLGPEINLPAAIKAIEQQSSAAASPLYRQFRSTPVPYTQELEGIVKQLKNEPSVLRDARRLANLDDASGERSFFAKIADDGSVSVERVPNAAEWDYIKRALDGLAYSASATKNDRRIYGNLSSKIKNEVDTILGNGDPSQSVWAHARAASSEGKGLTDALEGGQGAFSRGLSPDAMQAEISQLSQPEKLAYTLGARQSVRDTMGNAATKWGANDDTAARRMLGSDYARQKIEMLAGQQNASRLTGRLDTESAFDATREAARGNSITAAAQAAQKEFPNTVEPGARSLQVGGQTVTGLTVRGLKAVADAITGGALQERQQNIARDAARILTAQGSDRDSIAQALSQYRQSKGMTQQGKQAIDRILQSLIPAPRQATIDARTQ